MKILFYGAGVLGSLYAARLQGAGQEVSILARGQRLADIREHGIFLEDGDTGKRTTTRVKAVDRLYTYIDPVVPPLPEGSAQISPSWRIV